MMDRRDILHSRKGLNMTFKHEHQIPPVIWVVIGDRARARILSSAWPDPGDWVEVADFVHGEGAMKASELKTDRAGAYAEIPGGLHGGQPRTDYKHQTAERFAEEIVHFLEDGRVHHKFGKLGFVCPPLFLGVLRKSLPSPLANLVTLELDKDYTHAPIKEIAVHLKQELAK
jgi:protein required for attachment to host cells